MKKLSICVIVALAAVLSLCAWTDDDEKNLNPATTITLAELKDHIYFLASDFLQGRVVGTPGYEIASYYAISQLQHAGVQPLLKDADGEPSYLQKFSMLEKSYDEDATWIITTPKGEIKTCPGDQLRTFFIEGVEMTQKSDGIFFAGYGISEPEAGWDDIGDVDLKGKIVVVMSGTPQKDGKPVLPEKLEKAYAGADGFGTKLQYFYSIGVEKMIFLHCSDLDKGWLTRSDDVRKKLYYLAGELEEKEKEGVISYVSDELSRYICDGQEFSPYQNETDPTMGYKTFFMKDVSLQLKSNRNVKEFKCWNIIGVIPGKDEELKNEYVVLGGHLDHIPPLHGEICNGADDNATGAIAVLEVGEALAQKDNKRSVLVCLWGAEEEGLLGSTYFLANPPLELEKIKVCVNLDMIGRTDEANAANRAIYARALNNSSSLFTEIINQVNSRSVNWPLVFEDEQLGHALSDHSGFLVKGIPAVMFFSGIHEDYHQPTDDAEKIDLEKFLKVTRLVCNLVDELANSPLQLDSLKKEEKQEGGES